MKQIRALQRATNTQLSRMEKKLTRGDTRFTESWWGDFIFYMQNNHVVLAIFLGHKENPFSGSPRLIALFSSNVYAIFLAICITYERDNRTRLILEYTLVVALQSLYDLEVQYLTTCSCFHREGVPDFIRNWVAPCLGIFAGLGELLAEKVCSNEDLSLQVISSFIVFVL